MGPRCNEEERTGFPGTHAHDLIISHEGWLLCRVPGRALGAEVEEAEGPCGSGLVHGLEPRDGAVLTHALDLGEVETACSEGRHSDSPGNPVQDPCQHVSHQKKTSVIDAYHMHASAPANSAFT